MAHNLLPYEVTSAARPGELDRESLNQSILLEGGINLPDGKIVLRLPTELMAEFVKQRLEHKMPHGYWHIVPTLSHSLDLYPTAK